MNSKMISANMAHPDFKPRILAVTWNMAGNLTKQSLKTWLDTAGNLDAAAWFAWLKRALKAPDIPDIVILSLQEWNLSNAFPVAFGAWLNAIVSGGYQASGFTLKNSWFLRKYRRDFSQRLVVFVRMEHVPAMMLPLRRKARKAAAQRIKEAKTAYAARLELEHQEPNFDEAEFRKVLPDPALLLADDDSSMPHLVNQLCHGSSLVCTKGSIVVRMQLQQKPLFIVSSHFPFGGQDNIEGRNKAYHEVVEAVPSLAYDPTAMVIWLGDLNYRMQYKKADDKYHDQLRRVMGRYLAFDGYQEGPQNQGPFSFNPSCKMVVLPPGNALERRPAFHQARQTGNLNAYDAYRTPSWCDRILWHQGGLQNYAKPQLIVKSYTEASIDGSLHSDHTAIAAVLQYV